MGYKDNAEEENQMTKEIFQEEMWNMKKALSNSSSRESSIGLENKKKSSGSNSSSSRSSNNPSTPSSGRNSITPDKHNATVGSPVSIQNFLNKFNKSNSNGNAGASSTFIGKFNELKNSLSNNNNKVSRINFEFGLCRIDPQIY